MNRLTAALKNIGMAVGGIAILVLAVGLWATCQFAQGQVRPYLPPVVRDILTNPEDEFVIDDYLNQVDGVLENLLEDSDSCSVQRDQRCLTAAVEQAWRDVGDGVPIEASWMKGAHGRLRDALHVMWQINLRSETEPPSDAFAAEGLEAADELQTAVEKWYEQASR